MSPNFNIKRPTKKEMLAEKAEKRTLRLLRGRKLIDLSTEWWVGKGELAGLTIIFLINLYFFRPFFGPENSTNGFSAPLIPVLAELSSVFFDYDYSVRFWLLIFLLALPAAMYFFIREISQRRMSAFMAAFIASLPINIFLPLRIRLGIVAEDGGQVASLTLTVLTCLFLLRFLRRGSFKMALASSVGVSLVALMSPLGLFILLCFALALTFSEVLLSKGRLKLMRFAAVFVLAGGFSAFWYDPKFVFLIANTLQGEIFKATLLNLLPMSFFLAPLLGVFGFLLFENKPRLQALFLATFLTIGFGLLSLGAGMELSTPSRFLPSFGASLAFLIGLVIEKVFDIFYAQTAIRKLDISPFFHKYIYLGLPAAFIVLAMIIFLFFSKNIWYLEEPQVLGISDMPRVGIWEIRGQISAIEKMFGYGISGTTTLLVLYLRKIFKKSTLNERKIEQYPRA